MSTLSRCSFLLLFFALVQCSSVSADCLDCNTPNTPVLNARGIVGIVLGIFTLFSALGFCWRRRRIHNLQRTYLENAKAQASTAQEAQPKCQTELNAQSTNPQSFGATALGWQPVPRPEPAHQHHQAQPQHQVPC